MLTHRACIEESWVHGRSGPRQCRHAGGHIRITAEAASSGPAATPSTETALPASAIGVPDQVMSEGGAPDAAVRLTMKRSSDSSHSESETKKHHTDHPTRNVVMLLDDSDVSRAVEQCRVVRKRRFSSM